MNKFAVLGNPIAHSLSPYIHHAFARQTNISLSYQALQVDVDHLVLALNKLATEQAIGVNLTHPLKEAAFTICHQFSERARKAGSVNTLKFLPSHGWYGDNTDGAGLMNDLQRLNFNVTDKNILMLGAGGAARGVLDPLLQAAPQRVVIAARTFTKAKRLADNFATQGNCLALAWQELSSVSTFDLIINATSPLPCESLLLPTSILRNETLCYDMNYANLSNDFVRLANDASARYVTGLGMLVEQAAEAFYFWHGIRPEVAPVLTILQNSDDLSSFVLEYPKRFL